MRGDLLGECHDLVSASNRTAPNANMWTACRGSIGHVDVDHDGNHHTGVARGAGYGRDMRLAIHDDRGVGRAVGSCNHRQIARRHRRIGQQEIAMTSRSEKRSLRSGVGHHTGDDAGAAGHEVIDQVRTAQRFGRDADRLTCGPDRSEQLVDIVVDRIEIDERCGKRLALQRAAVALVELLTAEMVRRRGRHTGRLQHGMQPSTSDGAVITLRNERAERPINTALRAGQFRPPSPCLDVERAVAPYMKSSDASPGLAVLRASP